MGVGATSGRAPTQCPPRGTVLRGMQPVPSPLSACAHPPPRACRCSVLSDALQTLLPLTDSERCFLSHTDVSEIRLSFSHWHIEITVGQMAALG